MSDAATLTEDEKKKAEAKAKGSGIADPPLSARKPPPPKPSLTEEWCKLLEIGMVVHWYRTGTREDVPLPGLIQQVAANGLYLSVTEIGSRVLTNVDGIRHIDDKMVSPIERSEQGSFDVPIYLQRLLKELL